jgi:hypothetical protein
MPISQNYIQRDDQACLGAGMPDYGMQVWALACR